MREPPRFDGPENASIVVGVDAAPFLEFFAQRTLAEASVPTRKLAVSIPTQDVLCRFFTIPAIPRQEWEAAVPFEARKYIPFKIDELVWDYRIVPSPAAKRLEVIFMAIQRDIFLRFHEALKTAGVQPLVIEPASVSLGRLVSSVARRPSNEFGCLVDVEGEAAHLAIVKNGVPYLTREINLSVSPTPPPPAGPPGTRQDRPAELQPEAAETPAPRRLLTELNVSMDFFMREYPSTTINRVLLFGEEHILEPWCRSLAERLRQPVELGRALMDRCVQDELPLSFASAVGLLQTRRPSRGGSIDLLKRSAVKAPGIRRAPAAALPAAALAELVTSFKERRTLALTGVLAGAMLLWAWVAGASQVSSVQRHLDELIRSRADVGFGLSGMSEAELSQIKESATAQLAFLRALVDERLSVAEKLDALAGSLPEGVWLTQLAYEGRLDATGKIPARLLVGGACFLGEATQELSAIQQFEERLKRNPQFLRGFGAARLDHISVETSEQPKLTYRTFQVNCQPNRNL